MADKVIHAHSVDAYNKIIEENHDKLIVVDFSAAWCGPCKAIAPKFSEFSKRFEDVVFVHVDVDELNALPVVATVTGVPTFKFFKNKAVVFEFSGANAANLEQNIAKHK